MNGSLRDESGYWYIRDERMDYFEDTLLTAKDLQRIFHCSKNRAYEILHSHGFPTLCVNGRYYVCRSALNDWFNQYKGRKYAI